MSRNLNAREAHNIDKNAIESMVRGCGRFYAWSGGMMMMTLMKLFRFSSWCSRALHAGGPSKRPKFCIEFCRFVFEGAAGSEMQAHASVQVPCADAAPQALRKVPRKQGYSGGEDGKNLAGVKLERCNVSEVEEAIFVDVNFGCVQRALVNSTKE